MTIPEKPLEFNDFEPNDLTLDEMALFDMDDINMSYPNKLRKFLIAHSNWSKEEIGAITIGELKNIGEQLTEAIQREVIPLPSSPS